MKVMAALIVLVLGVSTAAYSQKPDRPMRYILYSLALPGSGEYLLGEHNQAKLLIASEAVLWLGVLTLSTYSDVMLDNAIAFARTNAGISGNTTNREFLLAISDYPDIYSYNAEMRLQRLYQSQFSESDPSLHWSWNSTDSRREFKRNRQRADLMDYSVQFVAGAIVINHAISAFNVLRLIRTQNRQAPQPAQSSLNLDARPIDPITGRFGSGIDLQLRLTW